MEKTNYAEPMTENFRSQTQRSKCTRPENVEIKVKCATKHEQFPSFSELYL